MNLAITKVLKTITRYLFVFRAECRQLVLILPFMLVSVLGIPTSMRADEPAPPAKAPTPSSLKGYAETLPASVVKVNMVAIPAGSVTIGGKKIAVKPFWIEDTEIPWEAFDLFLNSGAPSPPYDQTQYKADAIVRPSKSYILPDLGWGHHGFPAINVSFLNCTMFCRWLSSKTGRKYRLPTEAEWEYACRGGATKDPTKSELAKQAWLKDSGNGRTHPVGKMQPNAWKLYDMLGNVGEWATDLSGKAVLCGPTIKDTSAKVKFGMKAYMVPAWQETDPQLPKSRWWLSDAFFAGLRIVREP